MNRRPDQPILVGTSRPNQLMHTYGVGAVADMSNTSVITMGLDYWSEQAGTGEVVEERRLLAAVQARLGGQVHTLRLPPQADDEGPRWANTGPKSGVPVRLFPTWLRCTADGCDRLGRAGQGLFELDKNVWQPAKVRYVHATCDQAKGKSPLAVPARFLLACPNGHLDEFPWLYFAHKGRDVATDPGIAHTLKLTETGVTGEPSSIRLECSCGARRLMSQAFGLLAEPNLPACRGRHPHLDTWQPCDQRPRTMVLGATNMWFPLLRASITIPRREDPVANAVAEYWPGLSVLAMLDRKTALELLPNMAFWPELARYPIDKVWRAITRQRRGASSTPAQSAPDDLHTPEWQALTGDHLYQLPDFTTLEEPVPSQHGIDKYVESVRLVSRLREVAALYGFTRIDAPPWELRAGNGDPRLAPLSDRPPTWVPCAQSRGEGVFLRLAEDRLAEWAERPAVRDREDKLHRAHRAWRLARSMDPDGWPGIRYVLLHSFAHVLIREFALESGYGAAGIRERIYARDTGDNMAGILLYTAAPDSEGTLGGLVSLGRSARLGPLIERALVAAQLCSSDPLCAEHDPERQKRLYGASCHACLFAAETSCESGNRYLDRALLVDTLAGGDCGWFTELAVSADGP